MTEEKQQKFTAKVRRGLVWVHGVASAELADVESALTWIEQNKEAATKEST